VSDFQILILACLAGIGWDQVKLSLLNNRHLQMNSAWSNSA
jgi:hypothetical protein